jgi:hypothetical protein
MASDKAWYWLAAGVLALGLNGAYQDGEFQWAHRLTCHSASLVERASEEGLRMLATAEVMLGRNPESLARTEAILQNLQMRIACKRIEMARREVDMAQVQRDLAAARIDQQIAKVQASMDHVRMITIERTGRVRNCPELSRVIVMPNIPRVDLSNLPEISIPEIPAIPDAPRVRANGPI